MADTGFTNPGTAVSDSAVGAVAWSDPDNAKTSNNTYATGKYNYHEWPYEEYAQLVLADGSIGSTNKANTSSELSSYSETTITYGGSSDKWGETWSASDINDSDFGFVFAFDDQYLPTISNYLKTTNFGFAIPTGSVIDGIEVGVEYKQVNDGPISDNQIMVDNIAIKVYYTEGSTPTVGTKYPLPAFKNIT